MFRGESKYIISINVDGKAFVNLALGLYEHLLERLGSTVRTSQSKAPGFELSCYRLMIG